MELDTMTDCQHLQVKLDPADWHRAVCPDCSMTFQRCYCCGRFEKLNCCCITLPPGKKPPYWSQIP